MFVCLIISKVKGFSFEILLPDQMQTKGVVLIHHLRSVDWKAREIKFIESAPISLIEEICAKLEPLIFYLISQNCKYSYDLLKVFGVITS